MADWRKHWYGNIRGGKAERKRTGLVKNEKLPSREVEKEAGDHRIVVTCRVCSWAAVWRQYFNNESRDVRSRGSVGPQKIFSASGAWRPRSGAKR